MFKDPKPGTNQEQAQETSLKASFAQARDAKDYASFRRSLGDWKAAFRATEDAARRQGKSLSRDMYTLRDRVDEWTDPTASDAELQNRFEEMKKKIADNESRREKFATFIEELAPRTSAIFAEEEFKGKFRASVDQVLFDRLSNEYDSDAGKVSDEVVRTVLRELLQDESVRWQE